MKVRESNSRKFLDFLVDSQSLYQAIGWRFDLVSSLADWPNKAEFQKSIDRLLLVEPADFPNNRRSLLVCGECGGLDCGAISIVIEEQQNSFSWHSFGHERSWDDDIEMLESPGPFVFDKAQYVQALQDARSCF